MISKRKNKIETFNRFQRLGFFTIKNPTVMPGFYLLLITFSLSHPCSQKPKRYIMVDANPAHNPGSANNSLNQRREEKNAEQNVEQFIQDSTQRLAELTSCSAEAWQKQLDVSAHMARLWADILQSNQHMFKQAVTQGFSQIVRQTQDQTRRSA